MVCRDDNGDYYTYSFGGYHADDDERTVIQADSHGGPYFKSSPIDVHVCDVGKEVKKLCLKDWIDETGGLVILWFIIT